MLRTLEVTAERREVQKKYNLEHGIVPQTVKRSRIEELNQTFGEELPMPENKESKPLSAKQVSEEIRRCEQEMKKAAKELRFEEAAHFRDLLRHFQNLQLLEENSF